MKKSNSGSSGQVVYCRYITKNGKRIYPKSGGVFRFVVKPKKI